MSTDVNNIQGLADKPNAAGMSSTDLKQAFDKAGADLKSFLNNTLTSEVDAKFTTIDNTFTSLNSTISSIQSAMLTFNQIYPIGSIYVSVNSTNPGTLFGGSWERIQDRFLLASGSTYENGSTGGEATHTLTISEMPSHSHTFKGNADQSASSGSGRWPIRYISNGTQGYINNTGGGQAHNNMPPYLAVYVWKRVS